MRLYIEKYEKPFTVRDLRAILDNFKTEGDDDIRVIFRNGQPVNYAGWEDAPLNASAERVPRDAYFVIGSSR